MWIYRLSKKWWVALYCIVLEHQKHNQTQNTHTHTHTICKVVEIPVLSLYHHIITIFKYDVLVQRHTRYSNWSVCDEQVYRWLGAQGGCRVCVCVHSAHTTTQCLSETVGVQKTMRPIKKKNSMRQKDVCLTSTVECEWWHHVLYFSECGEYMMIETDAHMLHHPPPAEQQTPANAEGRLLPLHCTSPPLLLHPIPLTRTHCIPTR